MKIAIKEREGVVVLEPQLEIFDHLIVADLKKALVETLENEKKYIILNMANVRQIRSVGIGLIASAVKTLSTKGGELKLCDLDETGKELFELCKLNKRIDILDTEEEAIKSFGPKG